MKTILSAVRGWVVMGVILGGGGVVWGQDEVDVYSTSGCKSRENAFIAKDIRGKTKWKGECVDGYQAGAGAQLMFFAGEVVLERGVWVQGRRSGVFVDLYKNYRPKYGWTNYARPGVQGTFASRDFAKMDVKQRYAEIDKGLEGARSAQGLSRDELVQIIGEWTSMKNGGSPEAVFEKFSAENSADAGISNIPTTNMQDDPKVFGRGARGG